MNCMRSPFSGLPTLLVIALLSACGGATTSPPQESESTGFYLPSPKQMRLALPEALTETSEDTKLEPRKSTKGFVIEVDDPDRLNDSPVNDFADYLRDNDDNLTTVGGCKQEEPPSSEVATNQNQFLVPRGACFVELVKIALRRVASDYVNYVTFFDAVGQAVKDSPKGVALTYYKNDVGINSSVAIVVEYNQCNIIQSAPCETPYLAEDTHHHISIYQTSTYGQLPLTTGGEVDTNLSPKIFDAQWSVRGTDEYIYAQMWVTSQIFQDTDPEVSTVSAHTDIPPRIDFKFETDADGGYKTIEMKYDRDVMSFGSADEFYQGANHVRITKLPAVYVGEVLVEPAIWVVQGNLDFPSAINRNPIEPSVLYMNKLKTTAKVYFTAIAEDMLSGGKAIVSAVVGQGENSGGSKLDFNRYLKTSQTVPRTAGLSDEFHLWASYKKLLETAFPPDFYVGRTESPVNMWEADTGNLIHAQLDGTGGTNYRVRNFLSTDINTADKVITIAHSSTGFEFRAISIHGNILRLWNMETGFPVEIQNCPLSFTPVTLAADPSRGDASRVVLGTTSHQAYVVDMNAACSEEGPYQHQTNIPSSSYPTYVAYTSDGSRIITAASSQIDLVSSTAILPTTINVWQAGNSSAPIDTIQTLPISYIEVNNCDNNWQFIHSFDYIDTGTRHLVAVGSGDSSTHVIDIDTGDYQILRQSSNICQITGTSDKANINHVAFNPDGSNLLTTVDSGISDDGAYRWNIDLPNSASLVKVSLDPSYSGQVFYTPAKTTVAGRSVLTTENDLLDDYNIKQVFNGAAFSADGTQAALLSQSYAYLLTPGSSTYKRFQTYRYVSSSEIDYPVNFSVYDSTNGFRALYASSKGKLALINFETLKKVVPFDGISGYIYAIEPSPDGSKLATGGSDGYVRVWDLRKDYYGQLRNEFYHSESVYSLSFNELGTKVVSGGTDRSIKMWDLSSDTQLSQVDTSRTVYSLSFNPENDNEVLDAASSAGANLWDMSTATGTLIRQYISSAIRSEFDKSASPPRVITANGDFIQVFPYSGGSETYTLTISNTAYYLTDIDVSHDGRRLAVGNSGRFIDVFDIEVGSVTEASLLTTFNHGFGRSINKVDFYPDGSKLASSVTKNTSGCMSCYAYESKFVKIWDMTTLSATPEVFRPIYWNNDQHNYGLHNVTVTPAGEHPRSYVIAHWGRKISSDAEANSLTDYETHFTNVGYPTEKDQVNPYYLTPTYDTNCQCSRYTVKSTFSYAQDAETPDASFTPLVNALNRVQDPFYDIWLLNDRVAQCAENISAC